MKWGTLKEIETRRRIRLAMWVYVYEFHDVSIVSDAVYDVESYQVNLNIRTDRPDLDIWFCMHFKPDSGMWIHKHPELSRVKELYSIKMSDSVRRR